MYITKWSCSMPPKQNFKKVLNKIHLLKQYSYLFTHSTYIYNNTKITLLYTTHTLQSICRISEAGAPFQWTILFVRSWVVWQTGGQRTPVIIYFIIYNNKYFVVGLITCTSKSTVCIQDYFRPM